MPEIVNPTSVPSEIEKQLQSYSPILRQLLFNRNIHSVGEVERFINPSYDEDLHNPLLLSDMEVAVKRILEGIKNNEKIVIFSDYDCDGIPGAVILHDYFKTIGYSNFVNVIPHRHYDGFGLSKEIIRKIVSEHKPKLIITIDCGTTNIEAVSYAKELTVDIIITDHHEPGNVLPNALGIINPKIGSTYPFPHLCGAGVVYKIVQALIIKGAYDIPKGKEKWWLDMVGIATIADMVPLIGENRVLAHYGLLVLRKSRRPGLQQLLRRQCTPQSTLGEEDVGFTIGPRINAASRMDRPEDAFLLLATTDECNAGALVIHLEKLNTQRKSAVANMTRDLHKKVKVVTELPPVLVFGNPEWRPSLVGLAANKLAEEYSRPVFLWGCDGNEYFKGSCRSGGDISVVRLMEVASDQFSEYGGHHASGGFTVCNKFIHTFPTALVEAFHMLGEEAKVKQEYLVDAIITLEMIDNNFLKDQRSCAPFGVGNPKPLYVIKNTVPDSIERFGKKNEHIKLHLATSGLAKEAISFFYSPEQYTKIPIEHKPCSLIAHVEDSYFMNRHQVRLRIVDIV